MTDTEHEFRSFAQARSRALLRTAYLITGDHHHAEDLLQATLTKVFLAWPRIREKTQRGGVRPADARHDVRLVATSALVAGASHRGGARPTGRVGRRRR